MLHVLTFNKEQHIVTIKNKYLSFSKILFSQMLEFVFLYFWGC